MKGTYIKFELAGNSESGKTGIWHVLTLGGVMLGIVKWYGAWRKYGFFPIGETVIGETVFEEACLRDIAGTIEKLTKQHRAIKEKA